MTIKEAIGKFKTTQLTCRYRRMSRMGAPQRIIQSCRNQAQQFSAGKFAVHPVSETIWKIGDYDMEDNQLSTTPVIKIEGARGHGYCNEPQGILKLTTADNVYYYDCDEIMTTDTAELLTTIDEEFEEIVT